MRIFVAGAGGAIGRQLLPLLIARGHTVTGLTRSERNREPIEALGASVAVADALDPGGLGRVVAAAEPEVIVHQLTALSAGFDMRRFDRTFAATNRLRTEGTDNLLAAARAAGASRFVAQSFAGWTYARSGGPMKIEDDPLDPDPPRNASATLAAIKRLEAAVAAADPIAGIVLRYGGFYGPGTSLGLEPLGEIVAEVRKRRLPVIGSGAGLWSHVHIEDAASATVAAIERAAPGVYNIVDDDPAPAAEWIPALAAAVGAKPPRRLPVWLARPLAGGVAVEWMTTIRGASNAKAKRELGWSPALPSWRQGFVEGLD